MAKRILILSIVCSIAFFSCQKEDETFDFTIESATDLKVTPGETKMVDLNIEKVQGPSETVSIKFVDVPQGVTCAVETDAGLPNPSFATTVALIFSKNLKLGNYKLMIETASATRIKSVMLNIEVNDQLSMMMSVYDATQWTPERPTGELISGATINLYKSEADALAKLPTYISTTGEAGLAYFYHMVPGEYLFTVEKDNLSNIVEKTSVNGILKGFITTGIFQTRNEIYMSSQPSAQIGQLCYRDLNGDGKITDADRASYDRIMIYDGELTDKVIWIGN